MAKISDKTKEAVIAEYQPKEKNIYKTILFNGSFLAKKCVLRGVTADNREISLKKV